jgi:hypothetical protein
LHKFQQRCIEKLPEVLAHLDANPAHTGPYEVHATVLSVQPLVELLEPGATSDSLVQRGLRTIWHGLNFWEHSSLVPPLPLLVGAPVAVLPDMELGPFPDDPRVVIEVFRRKGQRIAGRIEIVFENHEPHPFDLALEQLPAALFHRTAQWGHTATDSSVTRLVRSTIQWSVERGSSDPMLIGVSPALEVLRLQLSPHTDRQKRLLFEQHGERFGNRDAQRLERPLWRLDTAENAVVIAVGSMWVDALARERGGKLGLDELGKMMNMDAPGVAELLAEYPQTRAGAAALIGAYTADPFAVVARLGSVLDP